MVAGPVYSQPITEGMVYAWYCETCLTQGRTERVLRNPMDQTTRFEIRCPDDTLTHVDVRDEMLVILTPQTRRFRHPRRESSVLQIRCLSGCEEAQASIGPHNMRDGRVILPRCQGPRFAIFVSEQLWRSGISRISYRHDGNYVIFDSDMKLVAEGREEPHQNITISTTSSYTFGYDPMSAAALSDYQRHVELLRNMQDEQRRREQEDYRSRTISPEEYQRRQTRNARAQAMTQADLEREQIWQEYQRGVATPPQEELTLTYNELVRTINSVERLPPPRKEAKPLEPRRRRAVIRRALEKK